jgi:hypothetical protein
MTFVLGIPSQSIRNLAKTQLRGKFPQSCEVKGIDQVVAESRPSTARAAKSGNKGFAMAVIEMANLMRRLRQAT